MRALTGSPMLAEDKLFATLDPTVRALEPETRPGVLVSDTVGFIKQLRTTRWRRFAPPWPRRWIVAAAVRGRRLGPDL